MDTRVSIGQVKRDISELLNRVAYGNERIILTSRGKPKAVIVNLSDYDRLKQLSAAANLDRWQSWLAESDELANNIRSRRQDAPLDTEALWQAARDDLEAKDDYLFSD